MDVDWEGLKTFLAIARAGNLSGAARQLGLTQPTVGRRLDALEGRIGRTLFQRTNEGFQPTDAGADILAHAERMELEAMAAGRRLAGQDASLDGLLRITSSDWFGHRVIAPHLAGFLSRHPGVSIELLTDTRWYSLDRREADLAFRFVPFDSPDVVQRRLMHIEFGLYASSAYLKKYGMPRPGAGQDHRLVTMDNAFHQMADVRWLIEHLPGARFVAQSNSREVQCMLCGDGAGLAVLPRMLADEQRQLRRVESLGAPPEREVWFGYHRDLRDMPRLRAFVEHVAQTLSDHSR